MHERDRKTDIHRGPQQIPRLCIASRGKNNPNVTSHTEISPNPPFHTISSSNHPLRSLLNEHMMMMMMMMMMIIELIYR